MVKASYIAAIALILIVAGGIIENYYIKSEFDYFDDNLKQIIALADQKQNNTDKLEELLKWWKDKKQILHAYIPHNEIREIDGYMVEAKNLIKSNEYSLATTRLRKLEDIIEAIPQNYSFNFGNVF